MDIEWDDDELARIVEENGVKQLIDGAGKNVADRSNVNAGMFLEDRGGGGIGSVQSEMDSDQDGPFARIAPDPEHYYMWFAEFGTSHEEPQPFIRPALFTPQKD